MTETEGNIHLYTQEQVMGSGFPIERLSQPLREKIAAEFGIAPEGYFAILKGMPADETVCVATNEAGEVNAILTGRLLEFDSPQQIGFTVRDDVAPAVYVETKSVLLLRNAIATTQDSPGIGNLMKTMIDHFLKQGREIDYVVAETYKSLRGGKVFRVYQWFLTDLKRKGIIPEYHLEERSDASKVCFIFKYTSAFYEYLANFAALH